MIDTFDFEMPVKMFDTFNDSIAFSHTWAGSQGNGIAPFPTGNRCVRFMRVAPGGAPVNKCFELARYIRPIGGSYRDDDICFFIFTHDNGHIVMQNALRRGMAASAPFAKSKAVIINADACCFIAARKLHGNNAGDLCCCPIADRTAVDNQCFHWHILRDRSSNPLYSRDPKTTMEKKVNFYG